MSAPYSATSDTLLPGQEGAMNGVAAAMALVRRPDPIGDARVKRLMSVAAHKVPKQKASYTAAARAVYFMRELEASFGEALEVHGLAVDAELDDGGQTILLSVVPLDEETECLPMTLRAAKGAPRQGVPPWGGVETRIQFRTPSGAWSEPGTVGQAVAAIVERQAGSQTRV
ncbi:MAG: hypothetical protein DI601_00310 [Azospirillum brasilense]|nr:MAG: hypothetical protein DI601_00310 [Azospirillum brasilense]